MRPPVRPLLASLLGLALGGCFFVTGATNPDLNRPAPQGGPGPSPGPGAPPASPPATPGQPGQPAKPQPVSLSIDLKNECSSTVHLFIGEKPGFSSGPSTTLGGNTLSSEGRDFDGSLTIWVTDDHDHGLSSVKVSPSQRKAVIGGDCKSIHAE
jgi:hypothetical protein